MAFKSAPQPMAKAVGGMGRNTFNVGARRGGKTLIEVLSSGGKSLLDPAKEKARLKEADISKAERERVYEASASMRERRKAQAQFSKRQFDSSFYRTLVFESEAQADVFMTAIGYSKSEMMVDGREAAARLKIALPSGDDFKPQKPKTNKKFRAMARE